MISNGNISSLSVNKAVEQLSHTYISAIKAGLSPKHLPSVMLWGPPGVGKSQAVRQIAKCIGEETGKECRVTDVRLLLFNPIDLRGIPTANADKTLSVWLRPQIFQMDESDNVINILFLDEISAAPQSVQAAAYQITLDRVVGEHRLPDNCIVIAAGNRVTDRSVAFKMPRALANRLCHLEIKSNFDSWKDWAIGAGINEKVVGFISFRPDLLTERGDDMRDDLAFPSPRSWEMVSNYLNIVDGGVDKLYPLISGCVGAGVAIEFRTYCKVYASLPKMEDIFLGKKAKMPTESDALYALISSMTSYAREHKDDMKKIENSLVFAKEMPVDYSTVLMRNYMAIEKGYKDKLMRLPEFHKWIQSRGRYLNGSV